MRQALLVLHTTGKPDTYTVGRYSDMTAQMKHLAPSANDVLATLYELRRTKQKRVPAVHAAPAPVAAPVAAAVPRPATPVVEAPKPQPQQRFITKGK